MQANQKWTENIPFPEYNPNLNAKSNMNPDGSVAISPNIYGGYHYKENEGWSPGNISYDFGFYKWDLTPTKLPPSQALDTWREYMINMKSQMQLPEVPIDRIKR